MENILLSFIRRKLPKIASQQQLTEAFKLLKQELARVSKDPFEEQALGYFDLISWLKSKIENRSFAEILREKVKIYVTT